MKRLRITVCIVNYNVRDFLIQALHSIKRALKDIAHEIIVVDNASVDGSVQAIQKIFSDVTVFSNEKNLGFSAANNIALRRATGDYIVLINPDTIVQEDTFAKLIAFMEQTPGAGAVTCKILNPDGSFSIDTRHSIPTPLTAFWKLIGLNRLFPRSKIFGRYNLTFLDPDQSYRVDAISGSFMFIRRRTFEAVGYLDESFFMYCEDIDYCYRIAQAGWKIYYFPETSIVHYKGESTKKNNLDYIITFNKSLYIFYKKYFHLKYVYPLKFLILFGVILRGIFVYIRNFISTNYPLLIDLFLLNIILFITFVIRFELKSEFYLQDFYTHYIIVNMLTSIVFLATAYFTELYPKLKFSFIKVFKANFYAFFIISALTFFLNQLAFSRLVVIIAAVFSGLSMILWRFIWRKSGKGSTSTLSKTFFKNRIVLVGTDKETKELIKRIKQNVNAGIELVGLVSLNRDDVGKTIEQMTVVSDVGSLREFARLEKIDQIIFSSHDIPYEVILSTMSMMKDAKIEFKIIAADLDVIIGKSTVERLIDYPLVDIDYAYGKTFNRVLKRIFDLTLSSIFLVILLPVITVLKPFARSRQAQWCIWDGKGEKLNILQYRPRFGKGVLNFAQLVYYIFKGICSFVGAPFRDCREARSNYYYKPGLTGMSQINPGNENREKFELYYLKNQSIWLDLEIILKALFRK
jgi:GT2 family glycosyltransferase